MSDDVLSVIPTDPYWQPSREAGDRAAALVMALLAGSPDADGPDFDVSWHDTVGFVDCGQNLERIDCPRCAASIDGGWWSDSVGERYEAGFANLVVALPCCGAEASLNDLSYEWPCGFASFAIDVWNPARPWLSDEDLTAIADVLGHRVRQIRAHI
jgi:hypothetical protein